MPQLSAGLFGLPGECRGGYGLRPEWLHGAAGRTNCGAFARNQARSDSCFLTRTTLLGLCEAPACRTCPRVMHSAASKAPARAAHVVRALRYRRIALYRPAGPAEVQQYLAKLQAALSESAPRLQAVFEKPGAQELLADVQWGLLQRFAARSIKFAAGLGEGLGGGSGSGAAAAKPAGRLQTLQPQSSA